MWRRRLKGHSGYSGVLRRKENSGSSWGLRTRKSASCHGPVGGHALQDVGAHRAGVHFAASHRLDHGVVDAAEAQGQIAPGVDAVEGEFPPGHLEAAERGRVHRHQGAPAQPLQVADVGAVGAGEDDPAENIALALPHPIAQGRDARDPVADLQVDVDARVDQDEIDLIGGHRGVDGGEIQGLDAEALPRQGRGQVLRGGGPGPLGGGVAAVAQDPDADLPRLAWAACARDLGQGLGPSPPPEQQGQDRT